ncbi:Tryptophan--tRNA ligase, chloroplastic/mitochondrial [Vitis vinifera]|uniref:tryptophan--tRNA ligase n=1 Tax=Vitis vinifera TaxID=29760 RepID=A0A438BPL7_VITVI|nr:Tryptophan--tRNA ligase, chloroplastic/mitochondrial [Vitis vinifera]
MGRSVLSHFLNLSNPSPRFTSSLYSLSPNLEVAFGCRENVISSRSSGAIPSKLLKKSGSIDQHCLLNRQIRTGFRCCCSISVSQPAGQESSSSPLRKRIVSGVQPTGTIHLGNYLGAIKNWIPLQNTYDTFFFIVDLHAQRGIQQRFIWHVAWTPPRFSLTIHSLLCAKVYMHACYDSDLYGQASVFVQSHVRAHSELMWLLSSATPIGWLNKMIQFKEKSRKVGDENVGVALLTYPVLMASDILLYQFKILGFYIPLPAETLRFLHWQPNNVPLQSDFVPVGEDQKQHLELTRELAERVNYLYGGRKWKKLGGEKIFFLLKYEKRGGAIFKVPEPLIPPEGARVMSLTDGCSKVFDIFFLQIIIV